VTTRLEEVAGAKVPLYLELGLQCRGHKVGCSLVLSGKISGVDLRRASCTSLSNSGTITFFKPGKAAAFVYRVLLDRASFGGFSTFCLSLL
jgi:hypothetical protein